MLTVNGVDVGKGWVWVGQLTIFITLIFHIWFPTTQTADGIFYANVRH